MNIKLRKVQRFDSIRLDSTYFTDEGYFVDHPILTSVGIFEYMNPDGSIRRELRLPEHVFDPESLKTYKGKPIIITHDAGVVDKNNVEEEQIGTIMSAGYRDGEDVRAEIIIHDTDAMKSSGLKELSLGYNLDLLEEPGVWNGEHYDAIQTNIRINHLALVDSARAGEQARLNIDGSDGPTLKGGKAMRKKVTKKAVKATGKRTDSKKARTRSRKRNDSVDLTPEELEEAIAAYVASKEQGTGTVTEDEEETAFDAEETLAQVQENKDRRDSDGEPGDLEGALEVILQQDEDIDSLLNVIEQLQAEADVTAATDSDEKNADDEENTDEEENADDDEENADEEEEENGDSSDDETSSINADSADRMIRQRLAICRVGDKLNMDGLESKSIIDAKKAIIKKVLPQMRLDGKGKAYINAAYDMAVEQANRRKDVNYQRNQMIGNGRRADSSQSVSSAAKSRQKMIERREGGRQ